MSESTQAPVQPPDDTHFENRYPEPHGILRNGGLAGVTYYFVPGHRIRLYTEQDPPCSLIDDVPVLKFSGPMGTADSVVVMGSGEPIKGAGDDNGIRSWRVDIELEETIGIPASPDSPLTAVMSELKETPKVEKKPRVGE